MTSSKDIRNLIIALIILTTGVWLIGRLSDGIIGKYGLGGFDSLILQFKQLSTTILFVLIALIALLIIVYIAKKFSERKAKPQMAAGIRDMRPQKQKF
jgi:hypothetical protein